jgi:type IV pilus assembly protein PilB
MRLVNMGVESFLIADSLIMVVGQRLVRRICKKCAESQKAPVSALIEHGFRPDEAEKVQLMKGRGCSSCNNTGYKGRIGLYEVMQITPDIRQLILQNAQSKDIKRKAMEQGMITLRRSGLVKVKNGITTIDEVVRDTVKDDS